MITSFSVGPPLFRFPWATECFPSRVYPIKYVCFVVLCFVVVISSIPSDSCNLFMYIPQGCFTGTGGIIWHDCPSANEVTLKDMRKSEICSKNCEHALLELWTKTTINVNVNHSTLECVNMDMTVYFLEYASTSFLKSESTISCSSSLSPHNIKVMHTMILNTPHFTPYCHNEFVMHVARKKEPIS